MKSGIRLKENNSDKILRRLLDEGKIDARDIIKAEVTVPKPFVWQELDVLPYLSEAATKLYRRRVTTTVPETYVMEPNSPTGAVRTKEFVYFITKGAVSHQVGCLPEKYTAMLGEVLNRVEKTGHWSNLGVLIGAQATPLSRWGDGTLWWEPKDLQLPIIAAVGDVEDPRAELWQGRKFSALKEPTSKEIAERGQMWAVVTYLVLEGFENLEDEVDDVFDAVQKYMNKLLGADFFASEGRVCDTDWGPFEEWLKTKTS